MNKKQLVVIGLMILCMQLTLSGCKPVQNRYKIGNFDDDRVVESFLAKFKSAVINNRRSEVSSMILYPAKASINGKDIKINRREEFIKLYDDIFTKELIHKIASFKNRDMWCNYQGVALNDGEVWFGRSCTDCNDIKVIAVGVCRRAD